jgi:hypothetical protein
LTYNLSSISIGEASVRNFTHGVQQIAIAVVAVTFFGALHIAAAETAAKQITKPRTEPPASAIMKNPVPKVTLRGS